MSGSRATRRSAKGDDRHWHLLMTLQRIIAMKFPENRQQ
jgi:hypothetical protein